LGDEAECVSGVDGGLGAGHGSALELTLGFAGRLHRWCCQVVKE
jgi:hypothetical protein